MKDLLRDFRYRLRTLARSPGFTAVAVLTLALGIGANTAIFSVVYAVLLRPLPYLNPGQLYEINEMNAQHEPRGISPAVMAALLDRAPAFDKAGSVHWQNVTLTGREGPENTYGGLVSSDCFVMLGVRPALGRLFRPDEFRVGAPASVILSDRLWTRRFGRDPKVLGTALMINGQPFTVAGVMPAAFFFQQRFELWTPWQMTADVKGDLKQRFSAVVRLKAGATRQQAQAQADLAYRSIAPDEAGKGGTIRLLPLNESYTSNVRPALMVLLAAVGFVLLIACLNVANLLLARLTERSQETAVRIALGASRLRIIRQLLTDSVLLSGLGAAAGLLLACWSKATILKMIPARSSIPRLEQTRLDATVLAFTLGLAVVTGLAFGLLPALEVSRTRLNEILKQGGRDTFGGPRSNRLRNILVIGETALSLVLLVGAGLMLRSFRRLARADPGFKPEHVLTFHVPLPKSITKNVEQSGYYTRLLERLQALPGVNAAGLIVPIPLGPVDATGTFEVEGRVAKGEDAPLVSLRSVSPGYFRSMGIAVEQGRVFSESDTADAPPVIVINQATARKYFIQQDPIGNRVLFLGGDSKNHKYAPIVGVVHDVKGTSMRDQASPEMYMDYRQFFMAPFATTITLRSVPSDPTALAATAQKLIRSISPDQPIDDVKTMEELVSNNVAEPRFYTALIGVFAAVALVLAVAGLYGVLSCLVGQRVHEIGIRMALGAEQRDILNMIVGRGLLLSLVGVGLGMVAAAALTRFLASMLYQVPPHDALTFVAVPLLLVAVALAATYVPARRATQVDPMAALRYE